MTRNKQTTGKKTGGAKSAAVKDKPAEKNTHIKSQEQMQNTGVSNPSVTANPNDAYQREVDRVSSRRK